MLREQHWKAHATSRTSPASMQPCMSSTGDEIDWKRGCARTLVTRDLFRNQSITNQSITVNSATRVGMLRVPSTRKCSAVSGSTGTVERGTSIACVAASRRESAWSRYGLPSFASEDCVARRRVGQALTCSGPWKCLRALPTTPSQICDQHNAHESEGMRLSRSRKRSLLYGANRTRVARTRRLEPSKLRPWGSFG
eukprot:952198-Rhodomonas_salina.7